ncbi:MAG: citrate synthase [Acidimicrobiales bacterium]|nr:citrate synthase [Acidimicrobiales bacterium]
MTELIAPPGLKGLAVADTAIGDVRGAEGFYHYRQYPAPMLARTHGFEAVTALLLDGELAEDTTEIAVELAMRRRMTATVGRVVADGGADVLAVTRAALAAEAAISPFGPTLDLDPAERRSDVLRVIAVMPTLIAAAFRARRGLPEIEPRPDLGHAANYLWMLDGDVPDPTRTRALERYLVSTMDHGFNASTFTARVITSTGADVAGAVLGAMGALSGPLHGGAPSRVLDMIDDIGDPAGAERWAAAELDAGRRLMGFGHAVYVGLDPRTELLRETALELGGALVDRAVEIERRLHAVLAERRPDRPLATNVEYYAAVVLSLCGIPRQLFTPTFAASRVVGWGAHILEQANERRIMRPSARYIGPSVHQLGTVPS